MTLSALQHLIRSAQALAGDRPMLVLGSASLLASFPELGEGHGPLVSTFDADICPDPFDELVAKMLDEALGENRAYYQIHGYHADVLNETILGTLPKGWRNRLIPVPDTRFAFALDSHDLAAVKLLVGRTKDLVLLRNLYSLALLQPETVRDRVDLLDVPVEEKPRILAAFGKVFPAK